MTPLSFDTWIELSLKGTIVLCAAVATCWAMWRASAASRHLVWAAAVSALLILPALSVVVPDLTVPVSLARLETTPPIVLPLHRATVPDRRLNASQRQRQASSGMAAPQRLSAPEPARARVAMSATENRVRRVGGRRGGLARSAPHVPCRRASHRHGRQRRWMTSGGTRNWRVPPPSSASHGRPCCCGRRRSRSP